MKYSIILFTLFLTVSSAFVGCAEKNIQDELLGSWACESGICPDEEISFAMDNGARVYNAWLHARPAAVNGTWQLNGNVLVVDCCTGLHDEWIVVSVTKEKLVLRDTNSSGEAVFSRI
jgi:hypothetical protein